MSTDLEKIILARLDRLETKIDGIINNGCSKVESHKRIETNQSEIFQRIRAVENKYSERNGKLIMVILIVGAVVGACIDFGFRWIGSHLG